MNLVMAEVMKDQFALSRDGHCAAITPELQPLEDSVSELGHSYC